MKIIAGLGNPGEQYQDTRHNIGFMVVEKLSRELAREALAWEKKREWDALIATIGEVVLVKPQTYMNNSGIAIQNILSYYKLDANDLWVIHDDIDLPLGKIRIRMGGASAGHNGIESIMRRVGTDAFVRFRLGIGRGKEASKRHTDQNLRHRSVIQFVLSRFSQSEAGSLKHLVKRGVMAVRIALTEGIDKSMNRFN